MSIVPPPDLKRLAADLETLSSYRDPDAPGWTRPVFSAVDRRAREWVRTRMSEAGLEVTVDTAGNLLGLLRGTSGEPGALLTGSHTDTVMGGGRFDGIVGVLGAIEVVRCLRAAGISLGHDLVVTDFLGEEPNDFGLSCVGSRAMAGALDEAHLEVRDSRGRSLGEALAAGGGDPARLREARWSPGSVHCYVELHIEQGPRLEETGTPIGVVTGIVGIHRLLARLERRPDHAGTTPMEQRRDALDGAAETVLAIERLARGGVATAGRLEIKPAALNVVPAEAELWAEARSDDEEWLVAFKESIEEELGAVAKRRRLATSLDWRSREPPVPVTDWVADAVHRATRSLRLTALSMPSGAGHDASYMARLGPMGMIFVPSRGGRSHCPEEWTDLAHIGQGVAALAETLCLVDRSSGGTDGGAG